MHKWLICLSLMIIGSVPGFSAEPTEKNVLVNGWYHWDPYQYITKDQSTGDQLTGLDIELTKSIAQLAGEQVVYEPVSWKLHQEDLKEGKRDFASGATYTDARAKFVYFSKPYRYEENSLFVRRGEEKRLEFQNIKEFLQDIKRTDFRLGVIDGYIYADPAINKWLEDPHNQHQITRVRDDKENIKLLLKNKIDGFLADRIVGATVIWREHHGDEINEIRLNIKTPIHFMFSKKSVPKSTVDKFNAAIDQIQNTDQYSQVISWYLYPVFLLQTISTPWFRTIEIVGTIAFAISGLMVAFRDRATLFGAFIFAVLPSLGGGIVRDVIFERKPVGAMQTPLYLLLVIGTVLIGFVSVRIFERINKMYSLTDRQEQKKTAQVVLMVCDAMGLAAFTVSGIVVSVLAKVQPLWLWGAFFAFITGAGGSILRDSLSKNRDFVALRGDIYPEIAVMWGFVLSIFLTFQSQTIDPDPIRYAVFLTVAGAFLTRLFVYFYDIPNIFFVRLEKSESGSK